MEPIINPFYIYLIGMTGPALGIAAAGASIFALATFFSYLDSKKNTKLFFCCTLACIAVLVFVPTESTCYKMLAASVVTPDNIVGAENNVVEFVQKIADAVKGAR